MRHFVIATACVLVWALSFPGGGATQAATAGDPYSAQGRQFMSLLAASDPVARARAAEALGYLRFHPAQDALIAVLRDPAVRVRRSAALALAWCGGRPTLPALLVALDDADWLVRQGAWVALTNLTGMEFPFDALEDDSARARQAQSWRAWVAALPARGLPDELAAMFESNRHREVERAARAAGALGADEDAVARLVRAIAPWRTIADERNEEAKWRVQAVLRALGRSGHAAALPALIEFLNHAQWARYAAEALGDFGGEDAAVALLRALPRYARPATPGILQSGQHHGPDTHPSDRPHLDSRDRVLAAPYAIALALSRIPFTDSATLALLRRNAPLIAAQTPLNIDGLIVYEEEPYQRAFRHLLDRVGMRRPLVDAAFDALGVAAPAPAVEARDTGEARSPVLRGGDEPHAMQANIRGWTDLYLVVDEVEDFRNDRVNWADARLADAQGEVVFLDAITPVSATQQHDTLWINRSSAFDDLRIGTKRFQRGLHTHARSVIHYRLDRPYVRFEAQTGVCASRRPGQGSARFVVSRQPLEPTVGFSGLLANAPYASNILLAFCRDTADVPRLIELLDHKDHWVRINAARALRFMDARESAGAIGKRLRASKPEAAYGEFSGPFFARAQGQAEFNDPAPRYREAFVMALGGLRAETYVPLLAGILNDDKNALGIQHRAALALDEIGTPDAVEALRAAELAHPYHSVRMAAREALWRRGLPPNPRPEAPFVAPPAVRGQDIPAKPARFVFIKGEHVPYNPFQMDSWRQAYMTTDSGPTYRPGRNLFVLDISGDEPVVTPLTRFTDGYVADCSASFDGRTVWFSRRRGDRHWWHLYRVDADGANLRQITDGPYHDVQPVEMPSGRIAFSSSRLGTRDEYHGYLCTGLATMHPDGSDIQIVGFNLGRDAEPAIADDGRLLFTRIELFYSRMKTEANLLAASPDGTRMQTLYGPERRPLWMGVRGGYGAWAVSGLRHRQLRLTQPQAYLPGQYLLSTPAGPVITRGRQSERILRQPFLRAGGNDPWVITTPWTLDPNTLLVAAGRKNHVLVRDQFPKDPVDLGIYTLCIETGELTMLYNDPDAADFEARPLHPREVPPVLTESPAARQGQFAGGIYAQSAFFTQEPHLVGRGKLVRIVEALPQVTRHATHTTPGELAWKNHGGTFARDLATLPLAADGSFAAQVPADRFLHLQVLDSDRNVVGNQLIWMNVRPGETKGCIGCHEPPDLAPPARAGDAFSHPRALQIGGFPEALPDGASHMRYRAKIWFKGHVPQEREERQRTVQTLTYFGR